MPGFDQVVGNHRLQRKAASGHGIGKALRVGSCIANVGLEVQRHVVRPLGIGRAQIRDTACLLEHRNHEVARARVACSVVRLVQDEHRIGRQGHQSLPLQVGGVDLGVSHEQGVTALRQGCVVHNGLNCSPVR